MRKTFALEGLLGEHRRRDTMRTYGYIHIYINTGVLAAKTWLSLTARLIVVSSCLGTKTSILGSDVIKCVLYVST